MKLPKLDEPTRYTGLYVFDFGDQCAVGYTAAEIAILLESEKHRHGKVYKIYGAYPDGRMELKGVPNSRFLLEDGVLFYRRQPDQAKDDFEELVKLAERTEPPCRAKLQLARLPGATVQHVVALIYPAEYTDEISRWLMELDYKGGDTAEGGSSQVTDYYHSGAKVLRRAQFWGIADGTSRPAGEVLAATHLAVQR